MKKAFWMLMLLASAMTCMVLYACDGKGTKADIDDEACSDTECAHEWKAKVDTLPKLNIRDEHLMQGARSINAIVIHCSASAEETSMPVDSVRKDHKGRGFRDIGYHFYITRDGQIHNGRWVAEQGAHVFGHNKHTIGICYEGGLRKASKIKGAPKLEVPKSMKHSKYAIYKEEIDGKPVMVTVIKGVPYLPADTRTFAQKKAMKELVQRLMMIYPKAKIRGHRDYSPDANGDGRITQDEWIKACPSFDAKGLLNDK